jgi:nitroreductase
LEIVEAIRTRKSIRGYRTDPVPREILEEILEVANRSPSASNVQPWEIAVLTGRVLEQIKRRNIELLEAGAVTGFDTESRDLRGAYRRRKVDLAIQLFDLMGIARRDREQRAEWNKKGLRFFDAPAGLILYADESLDELRTEFDIALITQSICLAALHYGLGTCIVKQAILYPDAVKELAGIPRSKRLIAAIAVGYPDPDHPANRVQSDREPMDNITLWRGFDREP